MPSLPTIIPDKAARWFAADGLQGCSALAQEPPKSRAVPSSPNGKKSRSGRVIIIICRASKSSFKSHLSLESTTTKHGDYEINWRGGHDRLAPGELASAKHVNWKRLLVHHHKLPERLIVRKRSISILSLPQKSRLKRQFAPDLTIDILLLPRSSARSGSQSETRRRERPQ